MNEVGGYLWRGLEGKLVRVMSKCINAYKDGREGGRKDW